MRVISGQFRGKKLVAAPEEITRPTSDRAKEALFNILNAYLITLQKTWSDIVFCDVFSGSGAVGIEAVSRGTKHIFFFENNKTALSFLMRNTVDLSVQIIKQDACLPPKTTQAADIIFMDPPYQKGLWEKALPAFLKNGWINTNTLIIVETDKSENINLPSGFVLQQERQYGRNKFLFLEIENLSKKEV